MADLKHPNIIRQHDYFTSAQTLYDCKLYIVLEKLDGGDLFDRVTGQGDDEGGGGSGQSPGPGPG